MVAIGSVEVVQLHLDIAGDVDGELERLVGCGGHLELVIGRRVHMQLVGRRRW